MYILVRHYWAFMDQIRDVEEGRRGLITILGVTGVLHIHFSSTKHPGCWRFRRKSISEGLRLLPYICGMLVMVSNKGGRVRAKSNGRADITYHFEQNDMQESRWFGFCL